MEKQARYVYLWYDNDLYKTGGSIADIAEYIFRNNSVSRDAGIEIHPVAESWFDDAWGMAIMKAAVDTEDYRKAHGMNTNDFLQKLLAFRQEGLANNKKWYSLGLTVELKTSDSKSLTSIREMEVQKKLESFRR